jgi:orotate phosphoribosyltransferase
MSEPTLAGRVVEAAYLSGDFLLRSGQRSHVYFDKYRFEADPVLLADIAAGMAPLIPDGTEILAGLELGGIPLATALSARSGLPAAFVRKERKAYGTERLAEGAEVAGRRVCVIEDIITTGGQVVKSSLQLREEGALVTDVLCVVWRVEPGADRLAAEGLAHHALLTLADLEPYLPKE